MKLSKLLVSCVAVGALAAACTTAAFADEYVKAEYKDGKVTLSGFGEYAEKAGGDLTLLILSADEAVTSENANTIIKQIDQFSITDKNYTKEVTVGDLDTTKTYYVRLGGAAPKVVTEQGFVATTFGGSNNPYANSTRKIGDVNGDGKINLSDIEPIAKYAANLEQLTGESLQAGDPTDDGKVNLSDIEPIAKYAANLESVIDGETTIAKKTQYVAE